MLVGNSDDESASDKRLFELSVLVLRISTCEGIRRNLELTRPPFAGEIEDGSFLDNGPLRYNVRAKSSNNGAELF